jgi:hypothetical protein
VDPEENDSHLVEPQKVRQVFGEIRRSLDVGALERSPEVSNALLADFARLFPEWGERARGVARAAKEGSQKLPVGSERFELQLD